jgi:hypothetical protein
MSCDLVKQDKPKKDIMMKHNKTVIHQRKFLKFLKNSLVKPEIFRLCVFLIKFLYIVIKLILQHKNF